MMRGCETFFSIENAPLKHVHIPSNCSQQPSQSNRALLADTPFDIGYIYHKMTNASAYISESAANKYMYSEKELHLIYTVKDAHNNRSLYPDKSLLKLMNISNCYIYAPKKAQSKPHSRAFILFARLTTVSVNFLLSQASI